MQGTVFSIEEFSLFDGPGIRTTVFLKGCPLRCEWCHNPEGQRFEREIVKSPNGCKHCGKCMQDGTLTQKSISVCPEGLIRYCGEEMDSATLCEKILKNASMLEGGGVTFSGGEPLSQSKFVLECIDRLKTKVHCAIQTCGYAPKQVFQTAVEKADLILFDLKLYDEAEHIKYTGVSNRCILENFTFLAQSGKEFLVRIPLIPSVSDTEENMQKLAGLLHQNGVHYVELLPYNKMAGGKYSLLGRSYQPSFDEQKKVLIPLEILTEYHIDFKVL